MQKVLKYIFIMFFSIIIETTVCAIDCEYPEAGLTITYDQNNVSINYKDFSKTDYYNNLLGIVKWGEGKYTEAEIDIDQELYKKYQGESCPSEMIVCEYTDNSYLSTYGVTGVAADAASIVTAFPCTYGAMSNDSCISIAEAGWSVSSFTKKLYIFDDDAYEKSGLKKYEGSGVVSNDIAAAAEEGFNACSGGNITKPEDYFSLKNIGWAGLGNLCAFGWGALKGVVWESVTDGIDLLYYRYAKCDKLIYDGPYASFNVNCPALTTQLFKHQAAIEAYTGCGDDFSCKSKKSTEVNSAENTILNYCSTILQNYNYTSGQKGCLDTCFSMKNTLNSNKKGTDLYIDYSDDSVEHCGFSDRLVAWIVNIIGWIKYLVPVIVIVLGILDFIKAIGSDKDDEMKKAQGRFVKRLIAAALIFLIPLLIGFILDKMGFVSNGCGIIKL